MPRTLIQPKRPAGGAFGVFLSEKRPEYVKALTGQPSSAVAKMGGEAWRKLKDAEKVPYQKEYERKKAKFDEDMAAFLAAGGEMSKGPRGLRAEKRKAKELKQKNNEDAEEGEEETPPSEEGEEETPPKKKASKALVKASPVKTKKVEDPASVMDVEEAFLKQLKGMLDNSSHGPQVLLDALQAAGGSVPAAKKYLLEQAEKEAPPKKKSSTTLMKVNKKGSKALMKVNKKSSTALMKVNKKGSKALMKVNKTSLKKIQKKPASKEKGQ